MKRNFWKKTAVALSCGLIVTSIGMGGNALLLNAKAEEGGSGDPSMVQNTVLETPEMTKGYLHIKSTVSDRTPDKTWDRWDGYNLSMKLMQSDLSGFTDFWWNIEAKDGDYCNSGNGYTECYIGFKKGITNYLWSNPSWGTTDTNLVYYSSTFMGNNLSGQHAWHRCVRLSAKGSAWYTISANKIAIGSSDNDWANLTVAGENNSAYSDVDYAMVWMPSRTFDADIAIGALYGVKADGSYTLLFDPSQAESVSDAGLLTEANKYYAEATVLDGAVSWMIEKKEATKLMPLHDGIGTNNYFDVPIANVLPEDISSYNGISYYIDNSANQLPTDLQLKITDKGEDGTAEQAERWYSDNQKSSFFYENSRTATGDYIILENGAQIPAGKKGTLVIPFSSFYQPWESNNKKFDLNHVEATLTLVYHPQNENFASNYSVGDFTLVTDAKAEFKEYRLYQKADGTYPEISVNGATVTYSDTANIKEIDRVAIDGTSASELESKASGIENESLYEYSKTEVKTEYTPVNGGGNVNAKVVPVTYYARKTVTVTFMNGATEFATKNVIWGGTVEFPADEPNGGEGKVFADWYLGTGEGSDFAYGALFDGTVEKSNITVYAKYGYRYVVKHHLQTLAGDGYDEQTADAENKAGDAGSETKATAKNYTGFTPQTVKQGTITADGSTVVNVYYTRNSYKVTFDVNGTKSEQIVKYGAKVDKPENPSVEGYTFDGWKLNGETFEFETYTMGTSDITLTATFVEISAHGGLPSWAIAVIVLGSVLVVSAAASAGIVVFLKKRKK